MYTQKVGKFIFKKFCFISFWLRMYAFWKLYSFQIFWKVSHNFWNHSVPVESFWNAWLNVKRARIGCCSTSNQSDFLGKVSHVADLVGGEKRAKDQCSNHPLRLSTRLSKEWHTCCLSRTSSAAAGSRLTIGLFLICLARSAYRRVFKVSSKLLSAGLTQAIIIVLLFPPRESVKNN